MKKIILFFFLAITFTSCKKDYPDDIPQWVKNRIIDQKRGGSRCLDIDEYLKGDSIVFKFYEIPYSPNEWNLYDFSGNYMCTFGDGGTTCEFDIYNHLFYSREIWYEDMDKCN